jgi:hypothetical protein
MFWWIGLAVLLGMTLIGVMLIVVSDAVAARRRFDLEIARYEPKHAVTRPRLELVPFPEPDPPKLTDTGELRALTDAWIAEHITGEGA